MFIKFSQCSAHTDYAHTQFGIDEEVRVFCYTVHKSPPQSLSVQTNQLVIDIYNQKEKRSIFNVRSTLRKES